MKRIILFTILIINALTVSATHNRAGEITYRQISDLAFEVTITTYTYTQSAADRDAIDIDWGDNSTTTVDRVSKTELPNYYRKNVYIANHTFPGPGIYKLLVQDPNRNLGVENIPNSVNVVFSISSILTVNTALGTNRAPILLNSPFDKAAVGYPFVHNPGAYDEDGDSLSYALTACTSIDGEPIENYTLPPASKSFTLDPVTGDLIWDSPMAVGKFNVAIEIQEWRDGKKIGVVVRDMQIDVFETDNRPPVITVPEDLCVEVGETINLTVAATDDAEDNITLSSTSGVYSIETCPAAFTEQSSLGTVSSSFVWTPCHQAVRNQAYSVLFKADDNNEMVNLVDLKEFSIKVLAPKPTLNEVIPEGKSIRLNWTNYGTDVIAGFHIYRREGVSGYVADSCTAGLPETTGFKMIGYAAGSSTVTYLDLGGSEGLDYGTEYTYRLVAVYPNGAESKPSDELTTTLISGVPVITNVSVRNTSTDKGSMLVAWTKPLHLDTIPYATGPYEFHVYRAESVDGADYQLVKTIPSIDLTDTVFVDTLLNTSAMGYSYRVELWNKAVEHDFVIGEPGYASSVYLVAMGGDRKVRFEIKKNVPWLNTGYDFFRLNNSTGVWDSIGTTNMLTFTDNNLVNNTEYCYYVRSRGGYSFASMPQDIVNLSEQVCVTPIDNEAPCQPLINVSSNCTDLYNLVTWNVIGDVDCDDNFSGFNVYFKGINEENLQLLTTLPASEMQYQHQVVGEVLSGCYAVSAFDAAGNESIKSTMVCVDSCNFYEIPNVFTPNGDGMNDYLVAKASGLVERVDFKIFTRTGVEVFSTTEPKLNWDGKYKGSMVPPGVYFYKCDVFELRITGLEQFHLSGFVHVIMEEGSTNGNIEY